jgi:nucleotide-binding universal stress UspA family protein
MAPSEKVHFVHVANSLDIPSEIRSQYPALLETVDEKHRMQETVKEHFECHPDSEVAFEVVAGVALVELLRLARQEEIDLVLVGKKTGDEGDSILPKQLARKAPCSVLSIPEGAEPRITKVLVPVDFSEYSADALDVAIAFASASTLPDILCLHVYEVPVGYYKSGNTYEDFAEILRQGAEKTYRRLLSRFDLKGVSVTPLIKLAPDPSWAIRELVVEKCVDLLVVGARGRTVAAAVLLGSVTERLLRSTDVPLLAVKKKGEGLGLLDALLEH